MAELATSKPSTQLKATCHCGAVTVIVPGLPDYINECQCTICRRYAAAWGYWKVDEVEFELEEGAKVSQYVWGDKEISFNFCANCGCTCYWWPFELKDKDGGAAEMGVNTRNMNPMDLFYVNRKIDHSWLFGPIKNPAVAHRDDQAKY